MYCGGSIRTEARVHEEYLFTLRASQSEADRGTELLKQLDWNEGDELRQLMKRNFGRTTENLKEPLFIKKSKNVI